MKTYGRIVSGVLAALFSGGLLAADCSFSGSSTLEFSRQDMREGPLNPQGRFSEDIEQGLAQVELKTRCQQSDVEGYLDVMAEHVEAWGGQGALQLRGEDGNHAMLREGYVSLSPSSTFFIDVGKKDIRNGQLFFVSPLDLLQRPANMSGRGYLKAQGVSWRDTYREGSVLLHSTWFSNKGNVEFALIPKLASRPDAKGLREYRTLQRTNSANQLYLAYGSNFFEDFNPRLVAVWGDGFSLGLGTSGFLTDDLIFTAEASVKTRSAILEVDGRHLVGLAAAQFPQADALFVKQQDSYFSQFAAGLRYTNQQAFNFSIEYLYQSQGLNKKQQNNYFDFLAATENLYQKTGLNWLRGYALVYAQEADDLSRSDLMMGRNYLMTHIQRDPQSARGLGFESAVIFNLEDNSSSLNLHVFSQIQRHLQVYLGVGYLVGKRNSEFGRFGNDGVGYAGIRAIW